MNLPFTHWQKYRYGSWRRIGDEIECYASQKTIPSFAIPLCDAHVIKSDTGFWPDIEAKYYIRVKVKGWSANIVLAD